MMLNHLGEQAFMFKSTLFRHYMKRRSRQDSPNNAIESPIIYELIGDFQK